MTKRKAWLAIATLLLLFLTGPLTAQTLRAGDDALTTPGGGQTTFDLRTLPIEQIFGAPLVGDGIITLRGMPFDATRLPGVDTVIRRPADVTIGTAGTATGPIRLLAINMATEQPVDDISNGFFWVRLTLSDFGQPLGSATFTRVNGDGGTFSATLPVVPKLTFINANDGSVVVVDCGTWNCGPFALKVQNAGWVRTGGPGGFNPQSRNATLLASGTVITGSVTSIGSSNFFPGLSATSGFPESPFDIFTPQPPIRHWTRPPFPPFPPVPPVPPIPF